MTFHPDKNLPGCMMPDGGDCCAGHAAVVADWHKQSRDLAKYRNALLWAVDYFGSDGISRRERNYGVEMLAGVIRGENNHAANYIPNDWDDSAKLTTPSVSCPNQNSEAK